MPIANYTMLGSYTLVPLVDIQNLVSPVNLHGDGRKGSDNLNRYPGMELLVRNGNLITKYISLSSATSGAWAVVDGSAAVLPVNVLNAGGGAAWTLTTATYTGGLLTASAAAAVNATQNVALKKGTYSLNGTVNRIATGAALKVVLSGGTSGIVLTKTFSAAQISAGNTAADAMDGTFTLTADETVAINLNIVNSSTGVNATGAAQANFIFEGIA